MKALVEFFRTKEWATFVTVVTAGLTQLPALAEVVQGDMDKANGKWTPTGLLVIAAGAIIRSNVWPRAKIEAVEQQRDDAQLELLAKTLGVRQDASFAQTVGPPVDRRAAAQAAFEAAARGDGPIP